MTKRKIVKIDEDKCNGCGDCITACAEGALELVDGRAKLVKENFCDGFGDCIGECPTGALTIEEADAEEFDMEATRQHVEQTRGAEGVARLEEAERQHTGEKPAMQGCPGSRMISKGGAKSDAQAVKGDSLPPKINESSLQQWPVQLHLVQPGAPFFSNKELVVLSTCAPIASADVHWRFMRGRAVVVGCPKLDNTEPYARKLGEILKDGTIPKVISVLMEVPCCGGLGRIVEQAIAFSGRTDLEYDEVIVGLDGSVRAVN